MVVLEEEMPGPREAVAEQRHGEQPARLSGPQRCNEHQQDERAADEVQAPAYRVRVLAQVVRVELVESREAALHGSHGSSRNRGSTLARPAPCRECATPRA